MSAALVKRIPETACVTTECGEIRLVDVSRADGRLSVFKNKSVALSGDAHFLFRWLTLLDGVAARLIIVPSTADDCLVAAICKSGGAAVLICDQQPRSEAWSSVPILLDENTLTLPDVSSIEALEESSSGAETEWVLTTSGTTRTPKLVAHNLRTLTRAMKADVRYSDFRWGLMYDVARFAGMQVMLQALLNGATVLAPDLSATLGHQLLWLSDHGCNAMSATPTLWRKMLMTKELEGLALRQVTLGGEIADEATINALSKRFPDARLTHVYASTEAGVGFAVHDRLAGFPEEWLQTGVRDVRLQIGDNGCLWVAPARVEQKYLGAGAALHRDDGWIDTGDVVQIYGGRVCFSGRLNGSINVGGNKVYPEEIEAVLLEVPDVAATRVQARSSSVTGNLVEALVVPAPEAQENLTSRIKRHCRSRLESHKVPAFIRIVDDLPVSAAGKLVRNI